MSIGAAPINITTEQNGPDVVAISWTAPPAPPAAGYQVQVTGAITITENVTGTSITISTNNQLGVYSIRVMSHSRHLPGQISEPVEVTVIGKQMYWMCIVSICSMCTCIM